MPKMKLPLRVVPEPWSVLYVQPMEGALKKQGRKCANCFMWARAEERCAILPKDLSVPGNAVCGYHVTGRPLRSLQELPNHGTIQEVSPETSGFETDIPSEGTMCGNCAHFTPSKANSDTGFCAVVAKQNDNTPVYRAKVQFYGCCTRWEG